MHQYSIVALATMAVVMCLFPSASQGAVLSCPPSNLQEYNPNLRSLCYVIEQALSENAVSQDQPSYGGLHSMEERNMNNNKRQDVDHVFLRFGRRLGL